MRQGPLFSLLLCAVLASGCSMFSGSDEPAPEPKASQFWRPISEPNVLLNSGKLQAKLDFDLGQCRCGIYPANATHDDDVRFQPDKQRLAQTSMTVTADKEGNCAQKPSLVVTECMRHRGWEPTSCAGRVAVPGGGAVCSSAD